MRALAMDGDDRALWLHLTMGDSPVCVIEEVVGGLAYYPTKGKLDVRYWILELTDGKFATIAESHIEPNFGWGSSTISGTPEDAAEAARYLLEEWQLDKVLRREARTDLQKQLRDQGAT